MGELSVLRRNREMAVPQYQKLGKTDDDYYALAERAADALKWYPLPMYEYIIRKCKEQVPAVERGEFGADMKVSLVNDGPFTIILDSENL